MNTMQTSNIQSNRINGYHLKMIALITMLIDHIAAVVIWRVYLASFQITGDMQLSTDISDKIIVWVAENQNFVAMIYEIMRYIGRMAFPIYCFLLVEGFLHTRSVAKYAGRLAVFALISEIPFDFAIACEWWSMEYSNVFFTLLLGLFAVWAMSYIEKFHEFWQEKQWESMLGWICTAGTGLLVVACFGGFAEMVLHTDYGFAGVIAIVILYLFRKQKEVAFVSAVLALTIFGDSIEILALFMLFYLQRYDGTRGKNIKYAFYIFYPAHLLILAIICLLMGV